MRRLAERGRIVLVLFLLLISACGGLSGPEGDWNAPAVHDSSTPEGAMLLLVDAHKAGDVEAAVQARDFAAEATLMLDSLEGEMSSDDEVLAKTTEVLELAYRQEVAASGFPNYSEPVKIVYQKFPVEGRDDQFRITERFVYRDGQMSVGEYVAVNTDDGWKIVSPIPDA